jgi:hypothetical protein
MAAPIMLIALGVWLLLGCIYIPTFNKLEKGVDASKKVGDAKSRKPLQVNRATRADVERELGPPFLVNADGTIVAYRWHVLRGVWLTMCFTADADRVTRVLVLRFDDSGVLQSFQMGWTGIDTGAMFPPGQPRMTGQPIPRPTAPMLASPSPSLPPPPPGSRYDTPPSP